MDALTPLERRVLGVLIEKPLTAANSEPLTLNAIVVGSNQKSNRDPVVNLEEPEVDDCLEALQRKGLVFRITGGRAERWRHNLYDAWQVSKIELALLGELLLRGPQTAAEARTRASRMEPIDQSEMTTLLQSLPARGLIVWLTPESRRGAVLSHGFHSADELQRLKAQYSSGVSADELVVKPAFPAAPPVGTPPDVLAPLQARLDDAHREIAVLKDQVVQLGIALAALQKALGVEPTPPATP
jgi:uncharacterized protein YceH (UPF0502 family)